MNYRDRVTADDKKALRGKSDRESVAVWAALQLIPRLFLNSVFYLSGQTEWWTTEMLNTYVFWWFPRSVEVVIGGWKVAVINSWLSIFSTRFKYVNKKMYSQGALRVSEPDLFRRLPSRKIPLGVWHVLWWSFQRFMIWAEGCTINEYPPKYCNIFFVFSQLRCPLIVKGHCIVIIIVYLNKAEYYQGIQSFIL